MLTPMQSKLLEMLKWLTEYLDSHNIRYYAVGGTVLGAARHQGFIPWDDDIDIAVPRKDYDRLVEMMRTPVDHYIIETSESGSKDFRYNYAKFYDMNTTLQERLSQNLKRGVFIDVFPFDGLGNTQEEALATFKGIDRLNMLLATKLCTFRRERSLLKNLSIIIGRIIPISVHGLITKINAKCRMTDYDTSIYVCNCMGSYREREIIEKSLLGEPTLMQFEDMYIKCPQNYDGYLTHIYRNWRQLPPENKRHTAHDFIELDLNKPYKS